MKRVLSHLAPYKRAFQAVFSLAVLAALGYQLYLVGDDLQVLFKRQLLVWVIGGVALYLLLQAMCAYKWAVLARSMGFVGALKAYVRFYYIGMFASLFLPTIVGGDVVRIWMAARTEQPGVGQKPYTPIGLSVFSERWTGLVALLVMMAGIWLWMPTPEGLPLLPPWLLGVGLAGCGGLLAATYRFKTLLTHRWLGGWFLHRLADQFQAVPDLASEAPDSNGPESDASVLSTPAGLSVWPNTSALSAALLLSAVFHVGVVLVQGGVLSVMGVSMTAPVWGLLFLAYGLPGLASMFPLALNGLGVREASAVFILTHWGGLPYSVSLLLSMVWLTILLLSALPGGVLWLKSPMHRAFSPAGAESPA
ncbi:MAG: flippase-like domain-containing protein [Cyanobacteria bacterium HKST-UBA04]|nr:flippase-like domain-containing protein [Cyanobacteria bacterium HKST-UBA04]